jgi:bacterioferritin-associated ferredoxin
MYVCICNAVSERRIRQAVASGDTTFEALREDLGVATCCGCCEEEVREILADCLERREKKATQLQLINNTRHAHAV